MGCIEILSKKINSRWPQFSSKRQDWKKIKCLLEKIADFQKQLRMYKEFWDHSADAFMLVRKDDGKILEVNPTLCSLYGYQREEILKLTMADISAEPECTRSVANDMIQFIPQRLHKNKSGNTLQITATVSYFNDQGYDVCACIIRPILEKRTSDGGRRNDPRTVVSTVGVD